MKAIIISVLFFLPWVFYSQQDTLLVKYEDSLAVLLNDLRTAKNDAEKYTKNLLFKDMMQKTLAQSGAFSYTFSTLKSVGFVDSPDGTLRIVNWNVEQDDLTQKYYCYLLHQDEKKRAISMTELVDNSFSLPPRPDGILDANNWYGALYYKIIPKRKGSKTIYTVLGWDGHNSMSTVKIIDALYFAGSEPKLGSPIFKSKDVTSKRIFFEHSKKTIMSLKYEESYDRIIFDHLSPETPDLAGFYSFYVPDLSYDAFVFDNNKWQLKEDVIGVNKAGDEKTQVFVMDQRSGKVERKEIKNKWQNPEDLNNPSGGIEHRAVTPEMENEELKKKTEKIELDRKASKKDKRDPNNLNYTLGGAPNNRKKQKH